MDTDPSRPWLERRAWADNQIRSGKRLEVVVTWCFAALWNLFAWPVAAASLPQHWRQDHWPAVGALGALLAAGLGLLVWAVRATRDARRFGDLRLVLDPFPGAIGGDFGATLDLSTVPWQGSQRYLVTLRCLEHYTSQSASDDSSSAREQTEWKTEGMAQVLAHGTGTQLRFRFAVPGHLPATQPSAERYFSWRVQIQSLDTTLGLDRSFDVPVYATGETAASPAPNAAQHPALGPLHNARLGKVCRLEAIPGGVRLHQPWGRAWTVQLPLAAMGGAIVAAGRFVGREDSSPLFPIALGLLGGALLAYALFGMTNSLRTELGPRGLRAERRILGLVLHWRQVPAQDIARLRLKVSYTAHTSTGSTTFYRVQAELRNGQATTMADSLPGRDTAEQLLRTLAHSTGYAQA